MQQHILVAEDYDHLFGSSLPSSTMKGKAKKNEITTDEARKLLRCLSAVPMRKNPACFKVSRTPFGGVSCSLVQG